MIVSWLTGGLGNQMFQYAAGLALAHARRTVHKLDVSWFREDPAYEDHNRYALSCFNITEQFATDEEIERSRGARATRSERLSLPLARALHFYSYANRFAAKGNVYGPTGLGFDEAFFRQPDNTYLHGMFQSERFFAPVADILRQHFTFRYRPLPQVAAMMAQIRSGPSAAVHFRRGDYVRNETFNRDIGVVGLDFYRRAIAMLRERHPSVTLYLFSDDIDAIEKEFTPPGPHVFVRVTQPWHSYDKVRLMSLCDHAIIANSTFSWWGAWLIANPDKTIFAPNPWFAGHSGKSDDVVPLNWVSLTR